MPQDLPHATEPAAAVPTAAEKVLHVLVAFEQRPAWALADLCDELDLPKSTVHRLLATLKTFGFVHQEHRDAPYRLGYRVWSVAQRGRDHDELAARARPILAGLVEATRETAFLTVREGLDAFCVARVDTPQDVRLLIEVGSANPLHLGASNTVLLAFADEIERSMVLSQTVLEPEERLAAEAEMRRIVVQRYAYSSEQLTAGAAAVGVPVFDGDGRIAACLSIGAPAYRFQHDRAVACLPELRRAARALESRFSAARTT
ncbi:MAG: IclR family transcriptional regulator [bacterium]|nr:IclR family transcriptional regulator [bacterium]